MFMQASSTATPQERRFQEYSAYLALNPPPAALLMVINETLKAAVDVVLVTQAQRRGDDAPVA